VLGQIHFLWGLKSSNFVLYKLIVAQKIETGLVWSEFTTKPLHF